MSHVTVWKQKSWTNLKAGGREFAQSKAHKKNVLPSTAASVDQTLLRRVTLLKRMLIKKRGSQSQHLLIFFWPCLVQSCFGRLQPPNGRPRPKQPRFFKSHIGILPIWFSMMLVTYICHFTKLASRGTKAGTHFKSTKDLRCRPTLYSSGFYRPPKCIYLSLVCLSHCANFLLANQGWFSFQFSGSLF